MASDVESLVALEALMNEFFAPGTSNERKKEIEGVLHNFSSQRGAWKHCLNFMSHSTNQYVCMYSLTTIETLITKQWLGLMWEERAHLKATLYQFALEHHQSAPNFIRNKLVKLVVDIARLDWPHFYPDFFSNILQLIQTPDTTVLGLVFLQTASEELVCPWEDLSVSRKEELRRLLLAHIPQVFNMLTGLLENILQKQKHSVTATPPPSPTHGQPNSASPVHTGSLLSSMLGSGRSASGGLDSDSETICCLTLNALTHLFSWVPLSSYITSNLVAALFRLASVSQGISQDEHQNIGTLAMGAINEIMYKNCVPASCEDFLLNIFQHAMQLMQSVIHSGVLEHVDRSFVEKLTEFLRLFVALHLHRLEESQKFSPVRDFLSLLFKYTFHTALEQFYRCLEVWSIFLDHMHNRGTPTERYQDALILLVQEILVKMQFKHNRGPLEELDDELLDDDEQTEWQHYLRQCIEIVAKVAELAPMETYSLMYDPWKEASAVYLHLERAIEPHESTDYSRRLTVTEAHECMRLHCLLRDLSSLTQAVGRMYPHFIGQPFSTRFPHAQQLVSRLSVMATYGTRLRPYHLQVSNPVLTTDLIEVHAQVLAALKAWCHWLAQLHTEDTMKPLYDHLVSDMVNSSVPLLARRGEPSKLCHSAAHLLVTLTGTVRPPRIWELQPIRDMYHVAASLTYLLPEAQRLVQLALCNTLLQPSPGMTDQLWDLRYKLLANLIDSLTADFQRLGRLSSLPPEQHAHPVITSTLKLLGDLVKHMQSESSHTKKLLYSVIQGSVHQTLSVFPLCVQSPDVCETILDFFLIAFAGLQQQLGATFTELTVQTFLGVFTREHLAESLGQESGAGTRVVEKFLQLLQLVMAEPSASFKRFVPSTISLCLDHVYPLVADMPSPDVKPALFGVLHAVLLHKWQYFYRTSVLHTLSEPGVEGIENCERFVAILRAYGQPLLQPDINLFGQNLHTLEELNSKWKLYHKALFREELLPQFLTVLLDSLIHKSHTLLGDEIAVALYNMAAVNFMAFHDAFLPQFLRSTDGLDDGQRSILQRNFQNDTDLPSFTQNIQQLVNDLRCYQLCNASLPAGSVKL
ncbi:Exportin-6 [Cryptotermes secundus]|uniref:Exportin-6 n=1 Tax=Cryptotermes secundus TaxID=105785 RepID=A0A2J7Q0D7_9NEOP|nr:exportin-6 isoform X2 [Cryptotermes secundus]PNF22047.1 Exportin-6 [Cryptotermes secundus]